jgi:hypothetical protein
VIVAGPPPIRRPPSIHGQQPSATHPATAAAECPPLPRAPSAMRSTRPTWSGRRIGRSSSRPPSASASSPCETAGDCGARELEVAIRCENRANAIVRSH